MTFIRTVTQLCIISVECRWFRSMDLNERTRKSQRGRLQWLIGDKLADGSFASQLSEFFSRLGYTRIGKLSLQSNDATLKATEVGDKAITTSPIRRKSAGKLFSSVGCLGQHWLRTQRLTMHHLPQLRSALLPAPSVGVSSPWVHRNHLLGAKWPMVAPSTHHHADTDLGFQYKMGIFS